MALANKVIYQDGAIREFEKPEVCEAIKVANANRWTVSLSLFEWDEREARLKNEYGKSTKAPVFGKEKAKEGNPALKEAASQFNDALLDEQGKKIKHLTKKIARLNKIIHKKNIKIEKFRKESSRQLRGKIKMFGENLDLEQELKDKNAVLSDVSEELRLTKIREKNLAELGLKYVGENKKLKKKLAEKIVDKIDSQVLKSAESALAYKEKVIAEKDEVIADLGKELAATKKELEEKIKLVEEVRKYSKEYREYGIEAVKMIRKMAKAIVGEKPICSEDFKEYRRLANGYMFNPQLPDFSEEEEKKLTATMVDINAKCMRAARESINDVFESYAAKYAKSTLDELKDKAYESFNAKAHKLGLVGSKDGNGIPDQMIRVDIAEEGGDQSATIVQCDNGIILSKEEAEIIERCTKNGTELHYSEKDGLTYTNVFGEEMPIRCLRGIFYGFTDEEIENMKK